MMWSFARVSAVCSSKQYTFLSNSPTLSMASDATALLAMVVVAVGVSDLL